MSTHLHECASVGCRNKTSNDFCSNCYELYNESRSFSQVVNKAKEFDPSGRDPHSPGAKVDAGKPRMHLITGGMARALVEVARIGTFGAAKYTDGGWVEVPDGFRRYEDAQQRHAAYRHMGEVFDKDSQMLHLAHEAWNALAKLDLYLREQELKQEAAA